jgi:hypothetical protein
MKLTKEELELLDIIEKNGGAKVYREDWPTAFSLRDRGLISVGWAKGPVLKWRRAKLVLKEMAR